MRSMTLAAAARLGWLGTLVVGAACSLLVGCSSNHFKDTASMMPVYSIEGNAVVLEGGVFEGEDGTVTLLTATTGDLNDDGLDDHAAILALNSRGSGMFYYLNAHLNNGNGTFRLAGEAFLGDRIKLDFTKIYGEDSVSPLTGVPIHPDDHGQLVIGYFTHGRNQAYAEDPAIYLTRHWKTVDGKLVPMEDY